MTEPYLAEIMICGFNFAPEGWAQCNGQLLPINQNQALFSLLGTNFGGNGQTTFALPDLRGRLPMHVGANFVGQQGGAESATLATTTTRIPSVDGPTTYYVGFSPNPVLPAISPFGVLNFVIALQGAFPSRD